MLHYVYMIECVNGSYYTGYTIDVTRRYQEHVAGSSKSKYTRAFPPKKLVAVWKFKNKSEALRFELEIKALTKVEKEKIVKSVSEVEH
ncbi:MAG: hypothetical protein A3E81_02215 [Gammaproteobacteria bacterium RIFCSPHIGHO2_12_FULL_36_30]|nr:MAG: hypothetical protein A3E81_02215 [Gammaproteobacteria bacterium RIFCSPHIGHO2_12_FULL_36_30]